MLALLVTTALSASTLCPPFEDHVAHYGLEPAMATAERAAIYDANCRKWKALNEVEGGARWGPDATAHLTPEEFSAQMGGCYHDAPVAAVKSSTVRTERRAASRTKAPITVDWREKGAVTPVKNQGAFGTCWSFGAAENLEGLNVRQGNPLANISEQEFISCCSDCQGRSADFTFEWLMNATGGVPALEATYPYVGKPGTCEMKSAPRAPVHLHSWDRCNDDGTGAPIAECLEQHGPMGMGVDATCFQGYKTGVIRNCSHSTGVDHAVLMVACGVDSGVSYFTIKNSWGQKWGEHGYVRIEQGHEWWGPISTIHTA